MWRLGNTMPEPVGIIPYFWIAFFNDGTILRQYEDDGTQHLFKEIDQSKLEKFGWFPFTPELAEAVNLRHGTRMFYSDPRLPYYVLRLKKGQRLIALRREKLHTYTYSHCTRCGFDWQWMPNRRNGEIGTCGLPIYNKEYSYSVVIGGREIYEVICPMCGARNELVCPECKEPISKVREDGEIKYKCLKCGREYPRVIQHLQGQKYEDVFLLGYQETINGRNHKYIMFIFPDGTFVLSDDFNKI